ncbi:MAG: Hsp70 family protein [Pseudonocardiales bacterium]|nr:Hsp70 family protein [Pseudonocardiales bacterium]
MTSPLLMAIDFGTSCSSAVVVIGDRMITVKEPQTKTYSFPSSVWWDGTRLLVGTAAERGKRAHPRRYRSEFKRDLGQDAPIDLQGASYSVVELVAAVLGALRAHAERIANEPVPAAVLTVPATYGQLQRDLMVTAARHAGFTERVRLVEEPIAAAFALAHGRPFHPGDLVLVYDFGGGTFDTALLAVHADRFEVVTQDGRPACDGLRDCGGRDIDGLLAAQIRAEGGEALRALLTVDPSADPTRQQGARRLQLALADYARDLKHQLSDADTVDDQFSAGPGHLVPVRFDQTRYRSLIDPLLTQTLTCCTTLLQTNGRTSADLAAILLVGGTTRIPLIAEALKREFQRPLRHTEDPELAVARGAARWASQEVANERVASIRTPEGLTALAVATNAPVAVSGGTDGVLRRWNLIDGRPSGSVSAHTGVVSALAISRDGSLVASGGRDGAVWVSRPSSDRPPEVIACHDGWVNAVRLAEGDDEDVVVFSVGDDGRLRAARADGQRGTPLEVPVGTGRATAYAVLGGWRSGAVASGPFIHCLSDVYQPSSDVVSAGSHVWSLDFDPTRRLLAAACDDGVVRVWKPPQPHPVAEWASGAGAVRDVRFGPNGLLASGHTNGTVRIWDLQHRGPGEVIGTHDATVRAVAFPSAALVVSAGADAHIRLWRLGRSTSPASLDHRLRAYACGDT